MVPVFLALARRSAVLAATLAQVHGEIAPSFLSHTYLLVLRVLCPRSITLPATVEILSEGPRRQ